MEQLPDNPFTPGPGLAPPHLAGHAEARSGLEEHLDRIRDGSETGGSVVLYGPPGSGKSALLGELGETARREGMGTIMLESGAKIEDPSALVNALNIGRGRSGLGRLRELFGGKPTGKEVAVSTHSLRDFDASLRAVLRKTPVVLMVDEAQESSPDAGRAFLQGIQYLFTHDLPILLVMAGTPRLPVWFLEIGAGFMERSEHHSIGLLEPDDAVREAFSVPLERAGVGIEEDALALLAQESRGYPLYVQMIGRAAWRAAEGRLAGEGRRITLEDAKEGVAAAKEDILRFHRERCAEAARLGVMDAAVTVSRALAAAGDGPRIPDRRLEKLLAVEGEDNPPGAVWKVADKLSDIGLFWDTVECELVPGIPLLYSHIATHGVESDQDLGSERES